MRGWPISRILSGVAPWTAIHLRGALPRPSSCQPGPLGQSHPGDTPREVPIWHCSRWGLPYQPCCQGRGGLLPHRFSLTSQARRFILCGAFPRVTPAGRYPAPFLCGVRTFLSGSFSLVENEPNPDSAFSSKAREGPAFEKRALPKQPSSHPRSAAPKHSPVIGQPGTVRQYLGSSLNPSH